MKEPKIKLKVFGMRVRRFYNGKWQDCKRHYRFKNKKDNPVAILRDILKCNGIYELKNFDKENSDKILGDLYLFCDEKIDGFIIQNPKLIK